jgi:hypothetical protein
VWISIDLTSAGSGRALAPPCPRARQSSISSATTPAVAGVAMEVPQKPP